MNALPQFMITYFVNLETLDVLSQKSEPERIYFISEAMKWCLLVFLKDTEEFAVTFNDLRYYYSSFQFSRERIFVKISSLILTSTAIPHSFSLVFFEIQYIYFSIPSGLSIIFSL